MKFIYDNFRHKPFKPLYNGLIPKSYRKKWHYDYSEIPTQMSVADFWHDAIIKYQKGEIAHHHLTIRKPELVGKKIIWQYWAQGLDNLPEVARLCFASVDKFAGDHQVLRLTDQTVCDYVDFPEFVYQKRSLPTFRPAYFADLLRTALIKNYGGVWLDASVFLTDRLPQSYAEYDFFVFSRDPKSSYQAWGAGNADCYFNWSPEFKVNFLKSIIFGKPNNTIATVMLDLLLYFWKNQTKVEHYFFYQILLNELKEMRIVAFDFPIVDDALPHLLQMKLNDVFEQELYNQIIRDTSLHKLTLHKKFRERYKQKVTFFGYLKNLLMQ